jgi:hypothetical protein
MNPNFVKTFDDLKRVREEYMNTLELQASNDRYNQQMNELYQATGQVPQDPSKARLGFQDYQQLKIQLKSGLLEIMNDTDRKKAVELLSQQPEELLFALGELRTLIQYFKPLYPRTVPYIIFVSYVRNLMKKTFRTNAYDARLQSNNRSELDQTPRKQTVMRDASTYIDAAPRSSKYTKKKKTTTASTGTDTDIPNTTSSSSQTQYADDPMNIIDDTDAIESRIDAKTAALRRRINQLKEERIDKVRDIAKSRRQDAMKQRRMIVGTGYTSSTRPSTSLLPFGKYAVSNSQLDKSKLALKTQKNNAVRKYPLKGISRELATVVRHIGNNKAFDVSSLDDTEKEFLYNLVDYAEVEVNLPKIKGGGAGVPCEDKDLHRFQVLKGTVLAGNNSKEVVDELKTLIVRMMNEDRIGRKEGQTILTDLVSLGF